METKIGINIITKTAREQELLIREREQRDYWEDAYERSLSENAKEIISKYTDSFFEIQTSERILKTGEVNNAIIFVFNNTKGIRKKELRAELKKYIENKFEELWQK